MFICAFLAVGCSSGGGGDSFVASPGGGVPAGGGGGATGAGSVTFNFVKAQSPIVVPTTTVQLRFEFFTGLQGTGTILKRELRDYADTVTIENVPNSVRSTVVTAITADGFPVAEFTANVSVPANGNVTVSSTDGTLIPVTAVSIESSPESIALGNSDSFPLNLQVRFSNGDVVPVDASSGLVTFSSSDPSVATVSNGNIVAGLDGTAFISATLNAPGFAGVVVSIPVGVGDGVQPPPTVTGIQILTPAANAITLPRGTMQSVVVQATFTDGSQKPITIANGLVLTSNDPTVPKKITISGQDVLIANDATPGLTARITATFQGQSDFFDLTVSAAELVSISATPTTVSLPYGGFTSTIAVTGTYTDGSTPPIPYTDANLDFTPNAFSRFTLNEDTGVITTNTTASVPAAGQETVTVTYPGVPDATVTVEVGALTVTGLTISPNPLTDADALVPGEQVSFNVVATLSDNSTVNVSTLPGLVLSTSDADTVAVDTMEARITAVAPTPSGTPTQITFTLLGADTGGADFVSNPVNVEVQDEVIDFTQPNAINYYFGGINIVDFPINTPPDPGTSAVNLPRGYVGVIEVEATFNSGVTRKLRSSEYSLALEDGPPATLPESIRLWQTDPVSPASPSGEYYNHPATNPDLFNAAVNGSGTFDDLYLFPRLVSATSEAPGQRGSTTSGSVYGGEATGVVLTRPTFRAVVADWRRGAQEGGAALVGPYVAAGGDTFSAPGGFNTVVVTLDPSVVAPGEAISNTERRFTVTCVDPLEVEIDAARSGFIDHDEDNVLEPRTPVNTLREYEVYVDFSAVLAGDEISPDQIDLGANGPTTLAITGFKLAEANVSATSAIGNSPVFARTAPTELGFLGIYSESQTGANNVLNVRAVPVGGDNFRSVFKGPAPDEYLYVNNVYGTTSGGFDIGAPAELVLAGNPRNRDVGGDPESDPVDLAVRVVTGIEDSPIQFVIPVLFSVNPPTDTPSSAVQLAVGSSQLFRTIIQFTGNGPYVDVSADYPPVLFVNATTPAAIGRPDASIIGGLVVSAINSMGIDVEESDLVTAASGDPTLGDRVTTLNGGDDTYNPTNALIVALDAAGFPIPSVGMFGVGNNPFDDRQQLVQPPATPMMTDGSAVSGLEIVDP